MNDLIIYTTEDGVTRVEVQLEENTLWLSQTQMAELYGKDKRTISEHIHNIYNEGELSAEATVRKFRIVQREGNRDVEREVDFYNLEMVLSIGYRVKSPRGTQFRTWATTTLREYLVKGFVMNDDRLKNPDVPGTTHYFDELLERIREIRTSEKLFYQKVRDIYSQSADYNPRSEEAQLFFKTVQNKMLYAVTGCTAAELVHHRSDPELPNMGLTHFKADKVRKGDVVTAKNYLTEGELKELNRIVTMFLDTAEDTAVRRQVMHMKDWEQRLDEFLRFNERDILTHAGSISHPQAEQVAYGRYAIFESQRLEQERKAAEIEAAREFEALKNIEQHIVKGQRKQ